MLVFANFTRFDKYFHIDPVAAEIYSIHFGQKRCAASVTKDKIPPQKAHRLLASKKTQKKTQFCCTSAPQMVLICNVFKDAELHLTILSLR